jgi:hypothetical protein
LQQGKLQSYYKTTVIDGVLGAQEQQFRPLDKLGLTCTVFWFDSSTREFYQINDQLTEEQVSRTLQNNYYQVYVLLEKF